MRVRTAIAMVILIAALVAGCGGSAGARAPKRGAEEAEGGIDEVASGPGDVQEGEMVAGEEGWVRSGLGVFWMRNGGRGWRAITPPRPDGLGIAQAHFPK